MAEEQTGPGPGPIVELAAEDEWEVVNDDGFVYKRRKRKHNAPPPPPPSISTDTTTTNDEQYLRQRRLLKKAALLNLKAKYVQEITEWESLSQMSQNRSTSTVASIKDPVASSSSVSLTQMQNARKGILRELLKQAEAQEDFIKGITSICDAAELICEAHERDLKQPLLDLPVWESPTTLVHSLCPSDSDDNA